MSEYTRHLRDAIFHARNARRSIELAQATAPEQDKRMIDRVTRGLRAAQHWAHGAARKAERRGGVRA